MRLSREKIEQIKAEIKTFLAKNPKASSREISKALGYDFKFINRLKNEIHREIVKKIESQTIVEEIGKFEILIEELTLKLWEIIINPATTNKERISAIKTLVGNYILLFEKKYESGILCRLSDQESISSPQPEEKHYTADELEERARKVVEAYNEIQELKKKMGLKKLPPDLLNND